MPYRPIDAAFRSSRVNECYLFVEETYVVSSYAPGADKKDIINGPIHIVDGFPMFTGTIFETGIDCAFDTEENEAFIFSGDQCAKIDYSPYSSTNARLLIGPISITAMFPCLKGTIFENGIDAALSAIGKSAILFKGDEFVGIDYHSKRLPESSKSIRSGIPLFVGTIFENGIDAAFTSHVWDEAYIFKGEYYAHVNLGTSGGEYFVGGRIKLIQDDWSALHGILKY